MSPGRPSRHSTPGRSDNGIPSSGRRWSRECGRHAPRFSFSSGAGSGAEGPPVGSVTWYPNLVPEPGTGTWYRNLVPEPGTGTWYRNLVRGPLLGNLVRGPLASLGFERIR